MNFLYQQQKKTTQNKLNSYFNLFWQRSPKLGRSLAFQTIPL